MYTERGSIVAGLTARFRMVDETSTRMEYVVPTDKAISLERQETEELASGDAGTRIDNYSATYSRTVQIGTGDVIVVPFLEKSGRGALFLYQNGAKSTNAALEIQHSQQMSRLVPKFPENG